MTGSGIVVYSFKDGKIAPERFMHLPLQQLAPGRKTKLIGGYEGDKGVPFPAAIAVLPAVGGNGERLLVADNLSDDVLLLDAATGAILKRFDLAESNAVPSTYPVALAVTKDGTRAFVALWNASEIVEIDLATQTIGRKLPLLKPSNPIAAGTHPCAFQFSPDGHDALCRARQSRRRGRRQCRRQCLRGQGLLRHAPARTKATSAPSRRRSPSTRTASVSTSPTPSPTPSPSSIRAS